MPTLFFRPNFPGVATTKAGFAALTKGFPSDRDFSLKTSWIRSALGPISKHQTSLVLSAWGEKRRAYVAESPSDATLRGAAVPAWGREYGAVACHSPLSQRNMGYNRRWKQKSLAERHYTGRFYTPINQDEAVFNDKIGRIWLRVFPTGAGPIYRFRAELRFCYPSGLVINYFPDDSLRELERAVRKARKVVRKWERFQMRPTLLRIVVYRLGWFR